LHRERRPAVLGLRLIEGNFGVVWRRALAKEIKYDEG
jgi:hypothetical protein